MMLDDMDNSNSIWYKIRDVAAPMSPVFHGIFIVY